MNIPNVDNPNLKQTVEKDSQIKTWLVNYVGEKINPKDGNITVEMIVEVMSKEFPEFLMVVAEENFIRGYEQAMADIELDPLEVKGKKNKKKKH